MSYGSRHGSHSYSSSSHGHHSSRSCSSRPYGDDYHRGPPAGLFANTNPFGGSSSSSHRPSVREYSPARRPSESYRERSPSPFLGRSSSTRRHDEQPSFRDPFGHSSSRSVDPFSSSRHSSRSADPYSCSRHISRSGSRGYDDLSSRPPTARREAYDHSALAYDRYDPFAGELGTGNIRPHSTRGDPELPVYRSASAYARGSNSHAPGYDVPGSAMRSSFGFLPPYASFSSQGSGGREPMQLPPTRRSSHYDRDSDLLPADYFTRKHR